MKKFLFLFLLPAISTSSLFLLPANSSSDAAPKASMDGKEPSLGQWQVDTFRKSLEHFDKRYPGKVDVAAVRAALNELTPGILEEKPESLARFSELKRSTFLKHPKLSGAEILAVEIPVDGSGKGEAPVRRQSQLGQMETHLSLSSVDKNAPGGAIVQLKFVDGRLVRETLVEARPNQPVNGIDLHWQGDRFLFSRREQGHWRVFEYSFGKQNPVRQVSSMEARKVDAYDAAYLPDGKIIFGSDAPTLGVPCWHGVPNKVANLYSMDAKGEKVRQLCYDQGHNAQPYVLQDGRVIFNRWDYTGMNRVFNQFVMHMRPDGTSQANFYGGNTWWPNGTFGHRELPGSNKLLCVVAGYHGTHRSGYLGILNPEVGDRGEAPLTKVITGTPQPAQRVVADHWIKSVFPKFTDPYPLDEDYYLASVVRKPGQLNYELCLVDRFGSITPLHAPKKTAVLNPVRKEQRLMPKALPSQVDLTKDYATVFIQDVYKGPGMKGVPRGVAKKVRVFGYDYGYPTLAGVDKIGMTGPWEVVQIYGETPVRPDGSALFKVPADTPISFQVVDDRGQAVQSMRTWTTAMPGERVSCVGCHQATSDEPMPESIIALEHPPQELEPWNGAARGFDFTREVQPLLNQKCAGCHDSKVAALDLRPKELVPDYKGPILSHYDRLRLHKNYRNPSDGERRAEYSPAYENLVDYIRRVGAGDSVSVLNAGEYRANTSPLIQLLERGHHGVELSAEEWKRLYMWIDLNGPQHGSWLEVYGQQPADGVYEKRHALRKHFGSKQKNLDETFPEAPPAVVTPVDPAVLMKLKQAKKQRQTSSPALVPHSTIKWNQMAYRSVPVAEGLNLSLVRIRPGRLDSKPIESFWMAQTEVSNALFAAFSKDHDSGYLSKRHDIRPDDKGVALNQPTQPVVRVSWEEAMAFCKWLSKETGITFTLPTDSQWEYACRAGSKQPFFFGGHGSDFSTFANFADRSFGKEGVMGPTEGAELFMTASDLESLHTDLVDLSDTRYRDGFIGTSPVNHSASNAFRLKNMHGNAAEWTLSAQGNKPATNPRLTRRVVCGGSFSEPPRWATADHRLAYPQWQRVYNVGFRVVSTEVR